MGFKAFEKKFDSFFSAIGHYMKEVFGDHSIESKVNGTLTLLTPAVVALMNLTGGPGASAVVSAGISQFKADYATLCAVTQGSFPAPGGNAASTVYGLIESLKQNLTAILADTGVKNSQHVNSISSYATFFLNEAEAILSELGGGSTAAKIPPVAQMPPATGTASAAAAAPAAASTPATAPAPDPTLTAANDLPAAEMEAPTVLPASVHQAEVKPLI